MLKSISTWKKLKHLDEQHMFYFIVYKGKSADLCIFQIRRVL